MAAWVSKVRMQQQNNCGDGINSLFSEFKAWSMINIDQLYHFTYFWLPYLSFISHFDSIHNE